MMVALLRRVIARAAPTCTLWLVDPYVDVLRFRFCRRLVLTKTEIMESY